MAMNLEAPAHIYACVVPVGMSDWTEIKAGSREGYEFNGYKSTGYVRADLVERLSDALRAHLFAHGAVTDDDFELVESICPVREDAE